MTDLEGATERPFEGIRVSNAGEFAAAWNESSPEHRERIVENLMRDQDNARQCWEQDHIGQLALSAKYPELNGFMQLMLKELFANAHKGDQEGWRKMSMRECWGEIAWHNAKLGVAVKEHDISAILEYAADTANMCMMLVDIMQHQPKVSLADSFEARPKPGTPAWNELAGDDLQRRQPDDTFAEDEDFS